MLLSRRLLLAALCGLSGVAAAGPVEVQVRQPAGQPLAEAVVFLESQDGKQRAAPLANVEIAQVGRRFVPEVTVVPVGSSISFPNRDTVRHHVYSFSPAKKFEIKLYVGTPAAPVVFDKTGIAVLGCNIHDNMTAWVVIVDTPWYGRTGSDGRLLLPNVPAGRYRLRTWHTGLPVGAPAAEQELQVEASAVQVQVVLQGLQR